MNDFNQEAAVGHARNERYTRIRARAGEIWQQEGCPGNQHERHWLLAMRQIDREDAALTRKPVKAARLAAVEPVIGPATQPKTDNAGEGARLRSSRI